MSSTPSRDKLLPTESSDSLSNSNQELRNQFQDLSTKYSMLERAYEKLLIDYRNSKEALTNSRRATAQLESELYAASRKVENAKKIQEEFLDTVSHELLTPLNGILGMARILEEVPLKTEIKESIDTIRLCGEDLERILKSLLDYIHLSKGEIDFIHTSFNLSECVQGIIKEYTPTIYRKNLEVTYLPNHGVYNTVEIDKERFEQIVHVLLSNAVKFTHKGHIEVRTRIKQKASSFLTGKPGHEVVLRITDTGIGISDHDLQHIFRPFEQLDSSKNRNFGGIGIGLTLCKEIITQMNGSIMIESEPDNGSTFAVSLPVQSVSRSTTIRHQKRVRINTNVFFTSLLPSRVELIETILTDLKVPHEFKSTDELKTDPLISTNVSIIDYPANTHERNEINELIQEMHTKGYAIIGLVPLHAVLLPTIKNLIDVVVTKPVSPSALADAIAFVTHIQHTERGTEASPGSSTPSFTRILLADNNPVNQKIILHLLGMLGCFVDTVDSLENLHEKFKPGIYSSIIINPDIGASTKLQEIKEFSNRIAEDQSQLIAITGRKSPFTLEELMDAGFDEHITLPTQLDTFSKILNLETE